MLGLEVICNIFLSFHWRLTSLMQPFVVSPLFVLEMMISSLLISFLIVLLSPLLRFGCCCLGLKVLLYLISFFTASRKVSII